MKKISTSLFLFLLFLGNLSYAQEWVDLMQNPNANFYDIQNSFNNYWEGRPIVKGKGYKAFKRWEAYMAPRVYPSGNITLPSQTYKNYKVWEAEQQAQGKSTNGSWTFVGPTGKPTGGGAGRVNFVRFDPNTTTTMWIGTPDGGLWKTTNGGTSWTTNTDQLPVIGCSDLAIDPTNTQTMYLATGDFDAPDTYSVGVLKSTDGGATWNTSGLSWTVNQFRNISRLLINPTNPQILIATSTAGIWRTTNGGSTWTQVVTSGSFSDAEFKPGDPNTVYACGAAGIRKSTNGGQTWTTVTNPLSGINRMSMAVTAANDAYVYILASRGSDNGFGGMLRSTDSGGTYTVRMAATGTNILGWYTGGASDTGGQGWYDLALAASPSNAELIFTGGINIWKSSNGGTSFTKVTDWTASQTNATYVHADIHDLQFVPGSSTNMFTGCDGGIFKSTNTGTGWSDVSSNLQIAQQYRLSLSTSNANIILAGHQDNGTNLTTNGTAWSQKVGGDGMDCLVDRASNNNMIASLYYGDYYRSTNGGTSFSNITDPTADGSEEWVSVIHQDPTTASVVYAGGRPKLYKCATIWGTVSWTALGTPTGTGNIIEFAIAPSNNQVIYCLKTGSNAVSKSTNGGTSFTAVSTGLPTTVAPQYIAISDTDPNVAYVVYSGYTAASKVYKTTNGGTSWTNISTGLPNVPVNCVVYSNGTDGGVYVGTDVGVYYRDNTMSTWVNFNSGLPKVAVRDLEIYYATGRLRAATFGRGTWDSDLYTSTPSAPVASFTGTPTTVCIGQTVQFTSTSTGNPTTYSWTFTGGTPATSTAQNPTVTYATAGTYTVALTVSNANGNNTSTQTGYITVISGTGSALPFTEGFTATTFVPTGWTLINTDGGTTSWARSATIGVAPTAGNSMVFDNYNFDDRGNTDIAQLPRLDFTGITAPTMTFQVAYAAYDATNMDGLEVLVSNNCGSTFTSVYNKTGSTIGTGNLPTAAATTSQFTPTTAQWRTETIDLTAYQGQSNIIIQFKNIAGYGNRLFVDNINITGTSSPVAPTASFTSTPTGTACTGQTVTYTSTSTGSPTSYSWTFAGGTPATSTAQNPTVTYATSGTYNVSLTVSNTQGNNTSNQTNYITVNQTPTITGSTPADRCGNGTVSLSASGSAGTLSWFAAATGGTALGTGATFTTPSISTTTTYYVSTTANGCTSARTAVIATIKPVPTVTNPGNKSVCLGDPLSAINFSGSSTSSTYAWTNNNTAIGLGASGNGNITAFTPSTEGTATVSVTPTLNGCTGNPVNFTITVKPVPTVNSPGNKTACIGDQIALISFSGSSTSSTYAWTNNNTAIGLGASGNGNITAFTPSAAGTATIAVTPSLNGCTGTPVSFTITVEDCGVGVDEQFANMVIVYPNPTSGALTIKEIPVEHVKDVKLFDAAGKEVGTWKVMGSEMNLDLTKMASGSYNLIFSGDSVKFTKKLVIKH
ncbi:MAG: hypothetical protein RL264_723 [Bacteroidota bacterium]|jgi:PKD repeat protein